MILLLPVKKIRPYRQQPKIFELAIFKFLDARTNHPHRSIARSLQTPPGLSLKSRNYPWARRFRIRRKQIRSLDRPPITRVVVRKAESMEHAYITPYHLEPLPIKLPKFSSPRTLRPN